jgi:hypothetical protein
VVIVVIVVVEVGVVEVVEVVEMVYIVVKVDFVVYGPGGIWGLEVKNNHLNYVRTNL